MTMDAMNAMSQASGTASNYFDRAVKDVEENYPNASDDAKCQAAATIALAASLDYLGAAVSGSISGTALQNALDNIATFTVGADS